MKPVTIVVNKAAKIYRDLNILSRICLIEMDQRRFECRICFQTFMESTPFVRPYRRYTIQFERQVYKCCKETNATYAASQFGISDHAVAEHKGHHDFILVITDLSNKRVIDVLKDRKFSRAFK